MKLVPRKHLPMCARCGHPVDHLIVSRDVRTFRQIFRAECHGEREDVVVDDMMLMEATAIWFTEAFQRERLLPDVFT